MDLNFLDITIFLILFNYIMSSLLVHLVDFIENNTVLKHNKQNKNIAFSRLSPLITISLLRGASS